MASPFPGMDPYLERHWRDVHLSLIAEARRIEHYEIAAYRSARAFATSLSDSHGAGVLQVEGDAGATAGEQVRLAAAAGGRRTAWPFDTDHVGPEVGEDRAGVRAGADPGELDDPDPAQGAGALTQFNSHASAS